MSKPEVDLCRFLLPMKTGPYAQLEVAGPPGDSGDQAPSESVCEVQSDTPPSPTAVEAAQFAMVGVVRLSPEPADLTQLAAQVENPDELPVDLNPAALLTEFARAVIPLCLFVSIYCQAIGGVWVLQIDVAVGLMCVVVGLAIFKYGLMMGLMPLGRTIGRRLPLRVPSFLFYGVTGVLGLLITFAEPGVNSLQLVGHVMRKRRSLLQLILRRHPFRLLAAIAVGVGCAASLGVLRLQRKWSIKPIVFIVTIPLLVFSALAGGKSPQLPRPATVPIVVALGLGIAHSARETAAAPEVIGRSVSGTRVIVKRDTTSDVEGFGVVTLASLFPVFTVMALSCIMRISQSAELTEAQSAPGLLRLLSETTAQEFEEELLVEEVEAELDWDWWEEFPALQAIESLRAVVPLTTFLLAVQYILIREPLPQYRRILGGIVAVLVGLFVFNTGLLFGSIPLGKAAGEILPLAAKQHGSVAGAAIVFVFAFVAGFIATIVDLEPCGLGETVEHLTRGKFTKRHLFASVAGGVGVGIILGFCKLLYHLNLMLVLPIGYGIALALTAVCDDGLATVAWDSAGVTTGPVTVPLVLSVGAGIANVAGIKDGFGILACASVCPSAPHPPSFADVRAQNNISAPRGNLESRRPFAGCLSHPVQRHCRPG
mmetsp:Transcript_33998/g.76168  ORF Transcript_33998/g.76168 Transcript_33998/m.76168 type:complete len:654 (-) Transcript_33998:56-2017(-)